MALPAGFVLDKPEKVKLPSGFVLDSDKAGLPSIVKSEPREAPTYDPLGQVIGDIPEPLDYTVEGQGQMNKPGAFTTISDLAKQFIAPGVKAPFALPQATETAVKGFARQAMEGTPEAIMPSSVFQPGLDTEETLFGPETDVQKARRKLQAQRAVAAMPSIPGAAALNKIGENVQKDILGSLSPEAKTALKESQITGNIFKGEVDFGTNPNAYGYALQAANVFGSMAPVIATAMVTKSPGAGGFVGGTMAADEAATSAAEFINKIPDAELRQKSPFYAELIAGGASPKEARALTIKKAAESGAALQGLVATFGDVLTGKLVTGAFDKTIAKLGTNRLARAGGVGAASSLEEALQETGEGLSSDVALKNIIPSKELGEDSAANFILGALGGAGPGVIKGALSEGEPKAPQREKYVQPEGGLAELMARQKGFLRPEGGPPAAPTAQAPVPPAPPAGPAETIQAPGSEAMDTQAMLEELINSVNYPQEKAPEVAAEKPKETVFNAPAGFRYTLLESPAYEGFEPLSLEDADFELEALEDSANKGRMTTERFAQSEIGKRLDTPQIMRINEGLRTDPIGTLKALRNNLAPTEAAKAPTTTPETREEYPTLSKTEVEELGLAPKPKAQKPAEPKIDYLNHPDNVGSDASSKREFDNKGKLQVAPQNIADGGTPFKSRAAADVARKNYPDMRVLPTADKKGFILAPKTPKQIEADKAKAKRLGLPMTTTKGTPMAAHQFITSEGGITKDAMKDLGMDENVRSGNRSLFTDTGMSVEQAYMKLQEAGYLEEGATQNDARNLITESVKKPKYRQQDTEEMAKRAEQADYEDYLKAEEEASLYSPVDEEMGYEMGDFEGTGYESASPEVQAEVRALLAQADALGINTESIREEIFYETENQSIQAYYKAFKSALEDAITASRQDRIEDTGQPGGEGAEFKLTSATPDEIRAKLYETESRAKEEERAKKAAEDKARADEQAAEFTLTGSDRAADVAAARGQRDIFAEAPAEEAPKPQTEQERTVSIPKKEFREDKETRGKSDHPALKMVFKGETPKSLIAKYGEKNVRFLGRLFDIDVKDKFNVAKKLIAIDSGLSLVRGKDKAYFDKMNKAQLGEFLAAVGQSAYGQKYQLVERLLKHEGNVMGKFNDNLQDLKHKAAVLNEARAGKPISEEVLKDYPDVAAFTLPRDSEGYKAAIRTLAVRALPTLGMDTPATIASYREDAKTTKDPLEKNVANDIADYMESYYKSQQEKSNQTMAKLGAGTGPTMGEMIAENKRVKAELAALEEGEEKPTESKSLKAMRGEKFVPDALDKKAIAIYKQIKENNPEAEVDEEIENPNHLHEVEEQPNSKGIKIGDLVYEKGDPVPKIAITVGEKSVKLIDQKTGTGLFSKIEGVSKEPIPHDYSFDFGYGNIDVDVETFTSPTEWSVSMSGPGASKTGYRSALGVVFKGKRGTPEFDKFVEQVVRNNTKEMAEAAPADNKKEIADLKKEQKTLMLQIIKAGLEETPEQEARMAEIDKRLRELEGKPAIQQVEKPVVKQRSVEEIQDELQDLEDQLDLELNKEKRKSLVSEISKLQGELTAAEGRAARAAAEEPAEEPEAPKGTVATPDGAVLRYPLAVSMVGEGYKVLALDDPRTYKDKGGEPHRTFEKGPLRIAMTPQRVLFQNRNAVNVAFGNPDQVTLEAIMVDPGKRNQGLATQAMNDVIEAADKNEITLYLEPVPIVNIKKNDFGLDRDQLVDFYSKFGFEFQEDSNKVMQRKPSAEAEVLPAEEPQIAGQVGFEPYTIEGDFTEVAEEQQRLMLEDQTENLSDDQVSTLEKHYGATIDSDEFFTKLREDVTNFIVKGATAVNGKIRAIIRQLANGVLAVGIAFNPQYMSQPLNVMMPIDNVRTEEVLAKVPDAATDKMSEPAKRAFAVIYPALQEQMVAKDKLFIMADKPSGRVFVFNPDGSLLLEKKSLFGLAKGDLYVGDNDKPQNRITPAGLFDLKFVDAAKGAAEKRTAGDYDTGTVLAINDPDGTITIMHSVWLKEKDAAKRAAALRNESPADSRYSFGCINVDAPTYKYMVDNHAKQMDGAALFIVPEAGVDVMSFITGKGAMSEDLARIKIKPVTKEVRTPQRQATQAEAKTKTPGREQQFFSLEKQTSTPAFKKFFGDSKVVDANGEPLIVYHGTNEDFVEFNPYAAKKTQGGESLRGTNAMFFTNSTELASAYTGVAKSVLTGESFAYPRESAYGGNVMPVYLSMQNPMIVDAEGQLYNKVEPLIREAKKKGHDGVIFKNVRDQPGAGGSLQTLSHDAYVVFKKEQIKSAIGNRGTFDESGNINMSLGDDMVRLVNQIADSIAENEKKRSPSYKRRTKTLTKQRGEGRLTDEEYLERMNAAIEEDEENRLNKDVPERVRGADYVVEKLRNAKRRKFITAEGAELAEWFVNQNPALVDDLGISVSAKGLAGVGGFYASDSRIINLIKDAGSSQTATHEILHHLERMMPTDIQNAIRKAWLTQLLKANKVAKDPAQRLYFMTLLDAHIGNNNHDRLEIPKDLEKIYKSAVKQMQFASALAGDPFGSSKSSDLAKNLLLYSPTVTNDLYEYFDPSEFWAVNGSDIVQARYEAVKGGVLAKLKNWLREFTQKIKSLLGLKSDASIIRALDSLAKSDGKFVTRKMLGTGEYRSIERRNYEGGEAPEPDMEIPEMSFMDDVIYKYGDKLIDTKRLIQSIQSTGRKINERFDAYMKEENYHGRLAKRTKNFLNKEMRPVLEDMQERGVTLDELETFLLNRHAKEANAYIAKINPIGFPEAGSSVSDAAADKYMAELTPEKRKDLMDLAAKIDKIVKETQRVLVANGLETQDTIDEWNKTYKHYVPLQRDNLDFVHTGRGVMGGFGTRGSASKRRVGSDKPVIDIFANIAMQRERALRRSEQARVGRALYGMAIKHPNPGFWLAINPDAIKDKDKLEAELISLGLTPEDARSIIQEPRQPMFDKKTKTVKYQVNPLLRDSPNVFPVRINGEDRFIFFNPNDPRALRMVQSMRNLDTETLGTAIGMAGMVTRWFASVNTQYNIVFGGVNFLRDLGAASLNLSTTEIAGKEKEVRAYVLPALRAIYRDLRGKGATDKSIIGISNETRKKEMAEMQEWFERFQMAGGQTGYQNQFAETKRKGNVVEQELKRLNRGNVKKSVDAVFDWLSDYNDAIENAVRLAAFRVAVEKGKLSDDKAASIAKNLTVNFNRKGAKSGLISALYAFFNAAVQGSARMVETLRGPMGKKIIFGGMFLGSMQAVVLAMAGFDDDEPPEFVKDKNLIIPIPFTDKKYLSVPMPLGFNMFPGFGRLAMETLLIETGMIRSRKGPGDKVMSAVSLVFDAFNPLGNAGNPLLMAMPTILDPFAAIYSNKDAFGRPIYREDKGTAPTPGYERSRENASVFSKKLAEAINWATSPAGTQHTKGWASPTADQIDYFIGQITGGVGRELMKVGEFAKSKAVTQEEVPAYKLPIVGRFYGEAESPAATRSRFYENVKEMAKHEHEIKGLRKDRVSPTEYIKANPEARLWQRANNVENQIVKLNKEKRAMIERDAPREALKRKEDEILKKMTEFNDQVRRGQ